MTEVIEVLEEGEDSVYVVDVDGLEGEASHFMDVQMWVDNEDFFLHHSVSLGELPTSSEGTLSFEGQC